MVNTLWLHALNNCMHALCVVSGLSIQISFPPTVSVASEEVFYSSAQQGSPVDDRVSFENG